MTTENTTLYPIATTYKYNGTDFPINFKEEINLAEMGALVQSITANVVDEDGYYPYLYDYAIYNGLLSTFSDFTVTEIMEVNAILNNSNIKGVVSQNIDDFGKIACHVDASIEYQKQKLLNKSEFDGLISDIRKIVADINDRFIKPTDAKTFQKLVKNLSAMKLIEKGLVDALIKSKVIDKEFPKKENKTASKSKIINFAGQQAFDETELKEDELE